MSDEASPEASPEVPTGGPRGTFRLALLGVLVVAFLVSAGCLVWLLAERRGVADDQQAARDAVMRQAEQFALRVNTYGPDQLDGQGHLTDYRDQVVEVMTPKFAAGFEESLPLAEQTVAQAGYGRAAEVHGVGVESIDADTAKVIVAASITGSYPDPKAREDDSKRIQADPEALRWEVTLVRTGGKWLVDDYTTVTAEEGQ